MKPVRIAVRWKLLGAFAGAYTIAFVFIGLWVVNYAASAATEKLRLELRTSSEGMARIINSDDFEKLVSTVPAVRDPSAPSGLGYPDSPLFASVAQDLYDFTDVMPEAEPYTYFKDPVDGQLYFAASAGYLFDPQYGVTYRQPVKDVSDAETQQLMSQGLTKTTDEAPYTDLFGSWISVYTPIFNSAGQSVGAVGADYPLDYVEQVRREAASGIVPILVVSYLVLLLLVLFVSSAVVRPLRRLTAATRRIADGEYDLDINSVVRSRFPDEINELGQSVTDMAAKVAAREKTLSSEVRQLRVQIDSQKREEDVQQIVETDFFADLEAKAAALRARMHDHDDESEDDLERGKSVGQAGGKPGGQQDGRSET